MAKASGRYIYLIRRCNNTPTSFPGLFLRKNGGREKALASASHVFILHPKILGVIN